ncbi:MAG: hypothetical protein SNJ82_01005 [Gemmataceae bacterium]
MKVQFQCPFCRAALEVASRLVGQALRCPYCQGRIAAPGAASLRGHLPLPDALQLTRRQLFWGTLGLLFLSGLLFLVGLLIGYYS